MVRKLKINIKELYLIHDTEAMFYVFILNNLLIPFYKEILSYITTNIFKNIFHQEIIHSMVKLAY